MTEALQQAHDHFLKLLLAQPGTARALLRERLPPEITARFTGDDPKLLSGDFIDAELLEQRSGLLYELPLRDPDSKCLCLLEHKSKLERFVELQLLGYQVAAWQYLRSRYGTGEPPKPLPVILPLVVYNGAPTWTHPFHFAEGVAPDDPSRRLSLDFPIPVFDLRRADELTLSSHRGLRGGLRLLRYGVRGPPPQLAWDLLVSVLEDLRGMPDPFLSSAAKYILHCWVPVTLEQLRAAIRITLPEKEEVMLSKAAEELLAEGEAKGEVKGFAKGEAKGFAKGEAKGEVKGEVKGEGRALLRLLEQRFGAPPKEFGERVSKATVEQLDLWLVRVLDATSLEEVFREP